MAVIDFGSKAGRVAAGGAVAVAAIVAAYFGIYRSGPEAPIEPVAVVAQVPEVVASEAAVEPAPEVTAPVSPDAQATQVLPPPTFDNVRIVPGDISVIAGRAVPGGVIDILVDTVAVERVTADASGNFASLPVIDPADTVRVLSLMLDPDGQRIASEQQLLIEPTIVPEAVVVAEAAPDAVPDATATPPAEVEEAIATTDPVATEPEAESSPTVLMADAEGVRVVQPATGPEIGPEVMSTVALDSITYRPAGDVVLSGRGAGDGSVRIYLDNAPLIEAPIAPDGNWSLDLPQIDTGIYTLRVDEISADGSVSSRIETPFQREEPSAIAAVMGDTEKPAEMNVQVKTVQPGATLWAIARETYGEGVMYVRVFEANRDRIRNPDLIYPGQVFVVPEGTE